MATYYKPAEGADIGGVQRIAQTKPITDLVTSGQYRDIKGDIYGDFYSGKKSLEETLDYIKGTPTYDPTKGPQIDYGQGPQSLNTAQQGALAGGKSIQDVAQIGAPVNPNQQAYNSLVGLNNQANNPALAQSIQDRYKQAAGNLPAGTAPSGAAQGIQGVKNVTPPAPAPLTAGQQLITTDENFKSIQDLITEHFKPENQRTSLVDEYKSMLQETGIKGLDTELLNMKNIIDGTEDDIRNEVTKAGGFATDSQVQALSVARNKQLVKNYNALLETRNSKEKYLDTLMNLTAKDREEADKQFETALNLNFKLADYQEKMQKNTKEAYDNIIKNSGYKGLYESALVSGDPDAFRKIQNATGLSVTALEKLATQPDLDTEYKKAQIANLYSEIAARKKSGESLDDPAQVIAYAQQYATTGQIPTGLPKGTFGTVAQVAKELPRATGAIVNKITGVVDSKSPSTEQQDFSRLYNILENAKRLKQLDAERSHGLTGGIGALFGSAEQSKYLATVKAITDDMQRMQSGAALTPEESKFYGDYLPGAFSGVSISPMPGLVPGIKLGQDSQAKIQNFLDIIDNRLSERLDTNNLSMFGYSKVDIGGSQYKVGDIVENGSGQRGRINSDGTVSILQ